MSGRVNCFWIQLLLWCMRWRVRWPKPHSVSPFLYCEAEIATYSFRLIIHRNPSTCEGICTTFASNWSYGWQVYPTRYKYLHVSLRKKLSMRSSLDFSTTWWRVAYPHLHRWQRTLKHASTSKHWTASEESRWFTPDFGIFFKALKNVHPNMQIERIFGRLWEHKRSSVS